MNKVYHIELVKPFKGQKHWYFGSKSAIFDILSHNELGITQNTLYAINLKNKSYNNHYCTIMLGTLYRKKGNRAKFNKTINNI